MTATLRSALVLPILALLCAPSSAPAETAASNPAVRPVSCATCGLEPETAALEKLLKQYRELADNGGWPTWEQGKKVKAGRSDPRIPILRQLLTITGDYLGISGTPAAPAVFDNDLAGALKRFQTRHGLTPDGQLGKSTQAALAVPVEQRIMQITATLERIRTRPLPPEPKFILVNLPAFTLYAIKYGHTPLSMRVIVGNRKNHTPLFDNAVTDVIFNPQWHVPERIAKKEMVPKLREDPEWFINAGFVVTEDGQPVDPMHVPQAGDDFSFRQLAGNSNALGKIKFNIPDDENIYLHSTSSPRLFNKDDRALSHGCIRVERPRELAHFVMEGAPTWDETHIDRAYDADAERWIKIPATPVHLVYWTAFVDNRGVPYFYNDIYSKDGMEAAQTAPETPIRLALKQVPSG